MRKKTVNQLKIGAILSYISIFLTFIVGLVYTPILIRMLGQLDYGIYSLVIALGAYLSLLDMGLGNAIVRYIARNREIGDSKLESDLVGQFLKFFVLIGLLTFITGGLLYSYIDRIFVNTLSSNSIETVKTMLVILTLNYAVSFPLNVYSAIVQAYERFIFLKTSTTIRIILVPILSYFVLLNGGGLIGIALVTAIVNLAVLIAAFIYSMVILKIKTTFAPVPKKLKKDIYIYSFFIFISAIADKIYWQTDQILLGIITNPEVVAIYAVAIQLVLIFSSLSNAISSLFLPKLSQVVINDKEYTEVNRIFNEVSKIQYTIITLMFSGFILFGKEFIHVWAGLEYISAYYIVLIIMVPFFIDLIQNLALMIMQARGLYYFRAVLLVICSILNIVVSIPIIKEHGAYGTAIVSSIFIFIGNVFILNFYFHIKLKLNMFVYWKNIVRYSIPVLILFILFLSLKYILPIELDIFKLIFGIILYTLCYSIIVWKFIYNKI